MKGTDATYNDITERFRHGAGARHTLSIGGRQIGRSAVSWMRFSTDPSPKSVSVRAAPEDTFLAIFQLREHPSHDFWVGGRHQVTPPAPAGCLNIVDLSSGASAILKEAADSLFIHVPREALNGIAEDAHSTPVHDLTVPNSWATSDRVLQQLQPLILEGFETPAAHNRLFIDHLGMAVAAHLATSYGGMRARQHRRQMLAPWQERRARELIASRLAGDVPLSVVADECGLSLGYFSRAFKASTGMNPSRWLRTCRIEKAKKLLLSSELSLADIALNCGFADQSHFARVFRHGTGLPPGAWRLSRKE